MSAGEWKGLSDVLPDALKKRIVSGERLALRWLETRIPEEMEVYPRIARIAHEIIRAGLTERVIQPGVTTTDDVSWWYRERIAELKLATWFHPSVTIQRNDAKEHGGSFAKKEGSRTIRHGAVSHSQPQPQRWENHSHALSQLRLARTHDRNRNRNRFPGSRGTDKPD